MSKNTTPPTHRIYAVTKSKKGNFWQPIGAIWPHEDGEGFGVQLDYLPLNPEADIVIRKPRQADEADGASAEA